MATTRRVRGVKPRAVIAAGLLAAAAIASIPARAATIPVLESTSVENGWSHGKFLIAKYDQDIRGTTAPAVSVTKAADDSAVLDGLGATITFDVSTSFSKSFLVHDLVVVVPNLTNRVDENNVPLRALPQGDYKMTVQATGRTGDQTSSLATKTFKVDNLGPSMLRITAPANRSVADPTEPGALALEGIVSDNPDSGAFRSGIASVQLFFYNAADPLSYTEVQVQGPASTPIPTYQPGEIKDLRRFAALSACVSGTPRCVNSTSGFVEADMSFESDISDLDPGVWTVRARATDVAGNQSAEVSVTFVKVA